MTMMARPDDDGETNPILRTQIRSGDGNKGKCERRKGNENIYFPDLLKTSLIVLILYHTSSLAYFLYHFF